MTDAVERAARAIIAYELWTQAQEPNRAVTWGGVTAESIIDAATDNIADWAYLSGLAIRRATELRGESAGKYRERVHADRKARRTDQRTGRRTVPKTIRRRAA